MDGEVRFDAWFDYGAIVVRKRGRLHRAVTYAGRTMATLRSAALADAPLVLSPAPGTDAVPEHRWLDGRLWTPDTGARSTGVAGPHRDAAWLLARLGRRTHGVPTEGEDATVRRVVSSEPGKALAELRGQVAGHALIDGMAWEAVDEPGLVAHWPGGVRTLSFRSIPERGVETYSLADLDLAAALSGPFEGLPGVVVHRPDLLSEPFVDEAVAEAASMLLAWRTADAGDAERRLTEAREVARDAMRLGARVDLAGMADALTAALARPWAIRASPEARRLANVAVARARAAAPTGDMDGFVP